jgi:hypothetical protein
VKNDKLVYTEFPQNVINNKKESDEFLNEIEYTENMHSFRFGFGKNIYFS